MDKRHTGRCPNRMRSCLWGTCHIRWRSHRRNDLRGSLCSLRMYRSARTFPAQQTRITDSIDEHQSHSLTLKRYRCSRDEPARKRCSGHCPIPKRTNRADRYCSRWRLRQRSNPLRNRHNSQNPGRNYVYPMVGAGAAISVSEESSPYSQN